MKAFIVKTKTKEESLKVINVLAAMGVMPPQNKTPQAFLEEFYGRYSYGAGFFSNGTSELWNSNREGEAIVSLSELVAHVEKELETTKTLKLNDEYSASITKDTVKVGCQTFPSDIVLEMARIVEELRKS